MFIRTIDIFTNEAYNSIIYNIQTTYLWRPPQRYASEKYSIATWISCLFKIKSNKNHSKFSYFHDRYLNIKKSRILFKHNSNEINFSHVKF